MKLAIMMVEIVVACMLTKDTAWSARVNVSFVIKLIHNIACYGTNFVS